MTSHSEKLFEDMTRTKSGWAVRDVIALYRGHGFEVEERKNCHIAYHSEDPDARRRAIPRTGEVWKKDVVDAVKMVKLMKEYLGGYV